MKQGKALNHIYLLLGTLVLCALAFLGIRWEKMMPEPTEAPVGEEKLKHFHFRVETDEKEIVIPFYVDGISVNYAILPSYADLASTRVYSGEDEIFIDEVPLTEGATLAELGVNFGQQYTLRKNGAYTALFFLQSANLPTMYLNTESDRLEYLRDSKEHREAAHMMLVDENGKLVYDDDLEWMSGRGNQTWEYLKCGWGIKLQEKTSLMGMRESKKWVLLANLLDETCGLRNYVAYNLAARAGQGDFTSEVRFIDLYLNNEYWGIYMLAEKIDEGEGKLDIGDLDKLNEAVNPGLADGSWVPEQKTVLNESGAVVKAWSEILSPGDVSGGYILERNYGFKLDSQPHRFCTEAGENYVLRYPSIASEKEVDYIAGVVQQAENALMAPDYIDPVSGMRLEELIDMESWAQKYLVEEMTKNEGAGVTSSFFYKKYNSEKLFAGPVWDFDKSLGFGEAWSSPEDLTYCSSHPLSQTIVWKRFYENPQAYKQITELYRKTYREEYLALADELDEVAETISASVEMDYIRWKDEKPVGMFPWLKAHENHKEAVEYLQNWMRARVEFLDSVWLTEGPAA